MKFADEIKNTDPDPNTFNSFETRANVVVEQVLHHIYTKVKHDVSKKEYKLCGNYKEWDGVYNLVEYKYDSSRTTENQLWEIKYENLVSFFDINYNYPSYIIHYRYCTEIFSQAEYISQLVVKRLEDEGFVCKVEKQKEDYKKGIINIKKWGFIGYNIVMKIQWS